MKDGFAWACEFGRTSVVEFLLERGVEIDAKLKHDGQTGLHWAACGGHAETVDALLRRGARVDAKDESYGGTPLGWTLYAWGNAAEHEVKRGHYYEVVARLIRGGAELDLQWHSDDDDRRRGLARSTFRSAHAGRASRRERRYG